MAAPSGFILPSLESLIQSERMRDMTEHSLVKEYLSYPLIPYKQSLQIDKIAILNFDCQTKQPNGSMQYKTFRELMPESFPPCKDSTLDYEDTEQVTPVLIISGDKKYRTDQELWFPLSDVMVDIVIRQSRLGKKLLPIQVVIDEKNQWLVPLMNLGKTGTASRKGAKGTKVVVKMGDRRPKNR